MAEGTPDRVVAWAREMRAVHARLRAALEACRTGSGTPRADLLLFCHGFCSALGGHHRAEDATLLPAVVAAHPGLAPVVARLEQDHLLVASLLADLEEVVARGGPGEELDRHLPGIAAIMESHFRYEERELLGVLEGLELDVDPVAALGPL